MIEQGILPARSQTKGQTTDGKSCMFLETQTFNVDIQRVVGQRLQVDMSTDVVHLQMGGIELSAGGCDIELVVGETGVSDDEGVDVQVERCLTGGVTGLRLRSVQ